MSKSILYLNMTPDIEVGTELIEAVAKEYGYKIIKHDFHSRCSFEMFIKSAEQPFEVLYFASHGDANGVQCNDSLQSSIADFSWPELGELFCRAGGLTANSDILLASCDAGFKRGAMALMANCYKINTVAGLPCKVDAMNDALIFHTYMHQKRKYASASQIEQAVTVAAGQEFKVYSRFEMDVEIAQFAKYCPELCWTPTMQAEVVEQQANFTAAP